MMKKKLHYYLLILPLLVLIASCSREEFDEYYARPDDLEDPIYQQLEARGNFTSLLTLIEKAGYKDILGKAGYWTMMAPNDEAFDQFLQDQGIANAASIDSLTAAKIVRYALIYNAFRRDRLSDYQSQTGWELDNSFRRRTAYYDGFREATVDGNSIVIVGSNRNNDLNGNAYVPGDNNNKYISYFMEEYFNSFSLSAYDYNYFYPNQEYTGFNVLAGKVIDSNIVAENGIIHEVDKVSLPLLNIDQHLDQGDNYTLFKNMLESNLVEYIQNDEATTTYRNFTGNSDNVYVKVYDPALAFSLNNENYLKEADNDGQSNAYSIFVPENEPLQQFVDEVLLKNYPTLESLPKYVFEDFFNAHMVANAVWPSIANSYNNNLLEPIRIDLDTDVTEAKVLSNGFFFGTSKIQESNLFFTVYTSAYLDPDFTMATRIFNDGSGYRDIISNINQEYTLFLPSDRVLRGIGYEYDLTREEWVYTDPSNNNTVRGTIARARLLRLLYNGVVRTPNGELDDLSGSGIIRTGDIDLPGEYIRWSNDTIIGAGNEVSQKGVRILGFEEQRNGRTYYIDDVISFSEEAPGLDLMRLAQEPDSPFLNFYSYLENSTIYTPDGGTIDGVEIGTSYTFVIPNNEAIVQAVKDGVLPGDPVTGEPNFAPESSVEQEQVAEFIKYHILATRTVSDDGLVQGQIETLKKTELGSKTYIDIINTSEDLGFVDSANRVANFIPSESNNLADRALIHLVDNYLLYTE